MATIVYFPIPAGITAAPLTICSPFLGLTLILIHRSTVSWKEDRECSLTNWIACHGLYYNCLKCFNGLGASTVVLEGWRMSETTVSVENRQRLKQLRAILANIEL